MTISMAMEVFETGNGIDNDADTAEQVAHLSSRIVILQQQVLALSRFPGNKDGKQQRNLLQQQIRTLYQQLYLLEQNHARQHLREENYLSVALSMATHAANSHSGGTFRG